MADNPIIQLFLTSLKKNADKRYVHLVSEKTYKRRLGIGFEERRDNETRSDSLDRQLHGPLSPRQCQRARRRRRAEGERRAWSDSKTYGEAYMLLAFIARYFCRTSAFGSQKRHASLSANSRRRRLMEISCNDCQVQKQCNEEFEEACARNDDALRYRPPSPFPADSLQTKMISHLRSSSRFQRKYDFMQTVNYGYKTCSKERMHLK
ncbi:hypothetical protein DBV15_00958 [Temnothorax longispinosus]|uniref:Uncharacterized protein n=1 Tax=Temnothorax longispinosus TaxID=300112 RepID=A0A4S2JEJ7_9HYME|nr:hypothetical protein DBV15_00958 [Temnothorax longispinosus]